MEKKANKKTKKKGTKKLPKQYCCTAVVRPRSFGPNVNPRRSELILMNDKKWVNGTILKYYFFDRNTDGQNVFFNNGTHVFKKWKGTKASEDVVRAAFEEWKGLGIGLEFKEVNNREEAHIRIGFMDGDGAWSYVGRDILGHSPNERTMNFGWRITGSQYGKDTVLHEIGHTLGFPHEHQNPNAGIIWDEPKVYQTLAGPPNFWDEQTTFHNIIRKIRPDAVQGSNWDSNSIMHYPIEPGLVKEPARFNQTGINPAAGLSDRDKAWVRFFYPPLEEDEYIELKALESYQIDIEPGEQLDFVFIPNVTKYYNIETFGDMDTVMVLFEEENGELEYRSGDDDSGEEYNAFIHYKLIKGHKYVIRLRLYYSFEAGQTAIMIFPKSTQSLNASKNKFLQGFIQ